MRPQGAAGVEWCWNPRPESLAGEKGEVIPEAGERSLFPKLVVLSSGPEGEVNPDNLPLV